jgi:hypothetical protein
MLKTEKGELTGTIQPSSFGHDHDGRTQILDYTVVVTDAALLCETDSCWPKREEVTGGW